MWPHFAPSSHGTSVARGAGHFLHSFTNLLLCECVEAPLCAHHPSRFWGPHPEDEIGSSHTLGARLGHKCTGATGAGVGLKPCLLRGRGRGYGRELVCSRVKGNNSHTVMTSPQLHAPSGSTAALIFQMEKPSHWKVNSTHGPGIWGTG